MSEDIPDGIKGIEVVEPPPEPMKNIEIREDPEDLEFLTDSTRKMILAIMRAGIDDTITTEKKDTASGDIVIHKKRIKRRILSVAEIVEQSKEIVGVKLTKNQLYHHLPKLIEHGYVIQYGTIMHGKRATHYYRRTAMAIRLAGLNVTDDELEKSTEKVLAYFKTELDEKKFEELKKAMAKMVRIQNQYGPRVVRKMTGDVTDPVMMWFHDWGLIVCALENPEYVSVMKRIRELLFEE